jgi:hypothetical protein
MTPLEMLAIKSLIELYYSVPENTYISIIPDSDIESEEIIIDNKPKLPKLAKPRTGNQK